MKRFILYVLRWECSTPVLWVVMELMTNWPAWKVAIIANFMGACIFFKLDKWIFKKKV